MNLDEIKEFLKDKRNKSFVILGLYIVFFIFAGSFFKTYKTQPLPIIDNQPVEKNNFCSLANYEYTYTYNINDENLIINGKVFRKDNYFDYNNESYYEKDNQIYLYKDDMFKEVEFNLPIYYPETLCMLYEDENLVNKNEDYVNKSVISKYSFSSKKIDNQSDEILYITLYEKDDVIYKVELDISNYANINNEQINNEVIEIEYKNIGLVSNFTMMFDYDKVLKGVD